MDFLFVILLQGIVLGLINYFCNSTGVKNKTFLYYLWGYHLLFCLIFWYYVNNYGGDALTYWKIGPGQFENYLSRGPGTAFIFVLNYPLVVSLGLSFLSGSILYASVGFLGFLFLYLSTVEIIETNISISGIKFFPFILFLPNLHFWSSGVSKDSIVFFGIGLFLFSTLKPFKRLIGVVLSLSLVYFIRPHITIFLLISFGIGFLLDNKMKTSVKAILSISMLAAAAFIFADVMKFLKLDELSSENLEQFSTTRVGNLSRSHTGSSIEISSYPLPLKIFTFVYRPLFFDARNITGLFASLENLLILLLTFKLFGHNPLKAFSKAPYQIKGLLLFFLLGVLSFSNILGNLGIMMRMKIMVMPALLVFLFWCFTYERALRIKKIKLFKTGKKVAV